MRLPLALAAAATALLVATSTAPAAAQAPGFTTGDWKRVETEHFLFVYPDPLEEWALAMARRMEAVHEAVASLVGYAPEDRVTVVIDDPINISNGSMSPGPLLFMFPTPPGPRSMIGENRGWGEILAVHEFAHAAHLTRPSRNPRDRLLYDLLPIPVVPIMNRTPRWATEGYAMKQGSTDGADVIRLSRCWHRAPVQERGVARRGAAQGAVRAVARAGRRHRCNVAPCKSGTTS